MNDLEIIVPDAFSPSDCNDSFNDDVDDYDHTIAFSTNDNVNKPSEDFNSENLQRQNMNSENLPRQNMNSKNLLRELLIELHGIFSINGITLHAQKMLLKFFKSFPRELLDKLPIDGRTLRPPPIKYKRRKVKPGVVAYWGIEQMFNLAPKVLFDESCNEIRLVVNMDGLPLYRTSRGKGFWPMFGNVEDYPVFVFGAYEGNEEPECANNYLRDFVDEVNMLIAKGITISGRIYKFRLYMMILDGPATSLITGVKKHGGYCACRRCKVEGRYVWRITINKKGVEKRRRMGVRYPTIDEELRHHEDFVKFAQITKDPHEQSYDYITNDFSEDEEENGENGETIEQNEETNKENGEENVDDEEQNYLETEDGDYVDYGEENVQDEEENVECAPAQSSRRKEGKKEDKRKMYHLHPSILTEIKFFDIVKDVILDLMHMLGGHMKAVLEYHAGSGTSGAMYKLPQNALNIINARLLEAAQYTPNEFERKPDSIEHLASWKATQLLQCVLYIGPVVFHGALDDTKLHHFRILAVAMRLLCRKLPCEPSLERTTLVQRIAKVSRNLLRRYFELGNKIYGDNFSRYLAHHIPHMPDDYQRFEKPLIQLSAFKFENANGQVKRLITGHFQPLTRLINKVSSLLYTKLYGRCEKNKVIHSIEEYYEEPVLSLPKNNNETNNYLAEHETSNNRRLECFQQLQLRNFRVRTDLPADAYFYMVFHGKESYVRIRKILRDKDTLEIFFLCNSFEDVQPFFQLGPSTSDISSTNVGINLCKQLSSSLHAFPFDAISEKCFALPLNLKSKAPESGYAEWVLTRFLH